MTLNVPYDCGVGIVAHPSVIRSTFGVHASYLIVADLVDRLVANARLMAKGLSEIEGCQVLNEMAFTQVFLLLKTIIVPTKFVPA